MKYFPLACLALFLSFFTGQAVASVACKQSFVVMSPRAVEALNKLTASPGYQQIKDGIYDGERSGDSDFQSDITGYSVSVSKNGLWNQFLNQIHVPVKPVYSISLEGDPGNSILAFKLSINLDTRSNAKTPTVTAAASGNSTEDGLLWQSVRAYSAQDSSYGMDQLGKWLVANWSCLQGLTVQETETVLNALMSQILAA